MHKTYVPVTVVVPVFNAANTLVRALDSICEQTVLPRQVVVVDDASEDDTRAVLEEYCSRAIHISIERVYLTMNAGASTARNAGWNRATESFIAFLDADDSWHPKKLEIQHAWMVANPKVVLCGHRCEVLKLGARPYQISCSNTVPVRWYSLESFLLKNRLSTPSVMLRGSIPERFLDGKRHSEDYLLWAQIAAAHGPVAFIDLPLTSLHKKKYGDSGLSGDLWAMRKGELDSLSRLHQAGTFKVNWIVWWAVLTISFLKYCKRYIISALTTLRQS